MKTKKQWLKSGFDLDEYLGKFPTRIDESLFMYLAEVVAPEYIDERFTQLGEPEFHKGDTGFHMTAVQTDDKFYYLGILPAFQQ